MCRVAHQIVRSTLVRQRHACKYPGDTPGTQDIIAPASNRWLGRSRRPTRRRLWTPVSLIDEVFPNAGGKFLLRARLPGSYPWGLSAL